ncbi:MAG: hypothetical protein M0002_20380 [Rhodospirillales bacterium]|nr:hypothetical protein [Rhodospirillales bacterium]
MASICRPWGLAIVLSGIAVLIAGSGLYAAAVTHALSGGGLLTTTFIACPCYLLATSRWRIVTTYICERFPTHVHASGYGNDCSLAMVIPAFADAYLLMLRTFMQYAYTPVVLLVLAGVLMIGRANGLGNA